MADGSAPTAEDKARFEQGKKELIAALTKKRYIDRQLATLESQIYNFEGSYLTDTAAHSGGNIIQGFDGYLKNQTTGRRKYEASDADRLFSTSSLTYLKSLELAGDGDESSTTVDDGKSSGSGLMTIHVPAAPKIPSHDAAQAKKLRDREYQRKKRANARGQSAGTVSDDESVGSGRRPTKRQRTTVDS
ncbi:NuA4-domain-containing protein [Neolentinus lepideus HHB14362 ss-1]|uniref:Chromatin modification-related protein EAF6 n=1 Tax=Neolentinus lepideus HHB14362 ss-1 TaxID=1314782 RepID=A0A165MK35_9AGAM|nr:NuA4-domain-containing protein [Neolentinus lepideus HHB14362 ss-1]